MSLKKFVALFPVIAIVSFLGFCVENIWLALTNGYMDNRNMHLPFLLGYGLAVIAIYAIFGTPQQLRFLGAPIPVESPMLRTLLYWLFACLCVMVGEIALGTFVEKVCGIIWWDYTRLPLHITRYTSVPTTAAFGVLITTFMGIFFTPLYTYFSRHQSKTATVVSCLIIAFLVIDFSRSALQMYKTGDFVDFWRWDLSQNPIHRFLLSKG